MERNLSYLITVYITKMGYYSIDGVDRVKKYLIAIIAAALLINMYGVFYADKAFACSCANLEPSEAYEHAEAVYTGKVLETKQERIQEGVRGPIEFRDANLMDIEETWKGVNESQIIVYDDGEEDSCGINFEAGSTYLVYSYRVENSDLYTSLCSRTVEISQAGQDLEFLGKGRKAGNEVNLADEMIQISNKDYDMEMFIGGVLLVILAVAAMIFLKRRRGSRHR